jgi:GNAT superfamily N-acetyltransferase
MQLLKLSEHKLAKNRKQLIRFFRKHGDERITKHGLDWLRNVQPGEIEREGNAAYCTVHKQLLTGVIIIVHYGIEESYMAVHRSYRQQKIGSQLLQKTVEDLGKLYARVATDNVASIKLCVDTGMVAFDLIKGPTGKPTLWFGGGEWKRSDIH